MISDKLVLLAEDDVVTQKITTLLLEALGYTVKLARNGKEAVEAVQSGQQFIVILMDCLMPEMDGFEATRIIRDIEKRKHQYTPIIAVTTMAMSADHQRCLEAGMDDYVTKPLTKAMLSIKIQHWSRQEPVCRNRALAEQYGSSSTNFFRRHAPVDLNTMSLPDEHPAPTHSLELFVSRASAMLEDLEAAATARNACDIIRLAQAFKVSSSTIGAQELVKLSSFLERLAWSRNWSEIERTISDLDVALSQVEEYAHREMPTTRHSHF